MKIIVPHALKTKLFYLPPLPIATTDRGHMMDTVHGFTSIRNKRIEINVYPPRNWDNIFKSLVHEVIHICFLRDSSTRDTAGIEFEADQKCTEFFDICQVDYRRERNMIHKSIEDAIVDKLVVFRKANDELSKYKADFKRAIATIKVFRRFFDAVLEEKVRAVPI